MMRTYRFAGLRMPMAAGLLLLALACGDSEEGDALSEPPRLPGAPAETASPAPPGSQPTLSGPSAPATTVPGSGPSALPSEPTASRPAGAHPCEAGTHDCDPRTTCVAIEDAWRCTPCPPDTLDVDDDGRTCQPCAEVAGPVASTTWRAFFGPSLPEGWRSESSGAPGGDWEMSRARSLEGRWSAHGQGALEGVSERSLVSAPIAVPAREAQPRLRFSMWHLFSGISLCFDGGVLEIQPQGSGSWSAVGSGELSVPYDAQVNNAYDNPRGGQPAWCFDRAWSPVEVDLSSWAGQEIRLRWRLTTDRTEGTAEGWYVDDVHLRQMVCP